MSDKKIVSSVKNSFGMEKVFCATVSDPKHTPYNKHAGEVKSNCDFTVTSHVSGSYLQFEMTETVFGANVRSKTISMTMTPDEFKNMFRIIVGDFGDRS